MWFGVWRCPIKSPVSHSASVSQLVLSLAWFPLFLQVCDELSMNSAFSGGVGLATLLIGMIWWFLGAFRIAGSFLLCLPPPPPWPDPPSVVPFGYARQWSYLSFPRHRRRIGSIKIFTLPDPPLGMLFLSSLLTLLAHIIQREKDCLTKSWEIITGHYHWWNHDDKETAVKEMPTDSSTDKLPQGWMSLRPFRFNITPFVRSYFDWDLLFRLEIHVPHYVDAPACTFTAPANNGLGWRLRRRIRRVEARLQQKGLVPHQFPSPLPPPEPPPFVREVWRPLFDSPWAILAQLPRPPAEPSEPLLAKTNACCPSWDTIVDEFIDSHDPSEIANIGSLGHAPLSQADAVRQVSLPIGRARDFSQWRSLLSALAEGHLHAFSGRSGQDALLIIDSGASVCISPRREDFISYRKSTAKIKDLSSSNNVAGEGMIRWSVLDADGQVVNLELPGYHIPAAEVRLLSPQALLRLAGGKAIQTARDITLKLDNGIHLLSRYCPRSHLPLLPIAHKTIARSFWSDAFAYSADDAKAFTTVLEPSNQNLSASQKEVLLWHHRLSHASLSWIQLLMRDRKWLRDNTTPAALHQGPFIPCKEPRGPVCATGGLKCAACLAAKARVRSPAADRAVSHTGARLDKFAARLEGRRIKRLKRGHTLRGDCISADHYISAVPGRLPHSYGREKQGYTCGTLFVDHASGKVFNYCQFSTNTTETLASKRCLETLAKQEGFTIKKYHADNGTFVSKGFKEDCDLQGQVYSFSGVGAHHQNGVAERNIGTIANWARASLLHAAYHWPSKASVRLWPMAIAYAIWVFNRLPQIDTGLCPNELWSQTKFSHEDFRRAHVFGCPVYVLEPKLQDGKKIPKWSPRARLGMFAGFSTQHSSLVPLVLNVKTGKISPQYHVIFDDSFSTVTSLPLNGSLSRQWDRLFKLGREFYLDEEMDSDGDPITSHLPGLEQDWLPALSPTDPIDLTTENLTSTPTDIPDPASVPVPVQNDPVFSTDDNSVSSANNKTDTAKPGAETAASNMAPEGAAIEQDSEGDPAFNDTQENDLDHDAPEGAPRHRHPRRAHAQSHLDGPAKARRLPTEGEGHALTLQPVPQVANHGRPSNFHPRRKLPLAFLAGCPILQDAWNDCNIQALMSSHILHDELDPALVTELDHQVLAAKVSKSKYDEDNPNWSMATQGPFQTEYWAAMETELATLVDEMKSWELVRRTPEMNVLPSTWAFRCKRRPDGTAKKFKARFCARGDRQKEGIDFFETYSPVAQWTTIRSAMVLAAKLGLVSAQCDITAAFLHAKLPSNENIYVHQPRGFMKGGPDYVLRLNRTLYGLRQAPRYFFKYLSARLERQGLRASNFDPCLFLSKDLIVVVYVDDLLLYARNDAIIDDFITRMQKHEDVVLRKEGTAEGFLGVDIQRAGSKTILTQSGLATRIIEALGLCSKHSSACSTPAD